MHDGSTAHLPVGVGAAVEIEVIIDPLVDLAEGHAFFWGTA